MFLIAYNAFHYSFLEPNLKLKMRVQLKNYANLEEAGIDGGGIFREFITELLLTCFDPNRGFFKLTQDQHLYPNPSAALIHQDCHHHYHFIGRLVVARMRCLFFMSNYEFLGCWEKPFWRDIWLIFHSPGFS